MNDVRRGEVNTQSLDENDFPEPTSDGRVMLSMSYP
jgi:hypothetical protein